MIIGSMSDVPSQLISSYLSHLIRDSVVALRLRQEAEREWSQVKITTQTLQRKLQNTMMADCPRSSIFQCRNSLCFEMHPKECMVINVQWSNPTRKKMQIIQPPTHIQASK